MASTQIVESQTLTGAEAARYIGMSDSWLRQSRMNGRTYGPVWILCGPKAIRYLRADLDRWLEGRRSASAPQPLIELAAVVTTAKKPSRSARRRKLNNHGVRRVTR
jgi:hypothetical protein